MQPMTLFGAAAPAGLMRYESPSFGDDYHDNLFAAQFNMHKVSRHAMSPQGATFVTRNEDFWPRTISTFTRPTSSRTPMVAWS